MRSILIRYTDTGLRLALAALLFMLLVSMERESRLPSELVSTPIAVSLPNIAVDTWDSRGHVVNQESFNPPLADAASVVGEAWRAVYKSVSGIDGGAREVSGAFFIPSGIPPADGWPVVSVAHGTTGIGNGCGPSRQPDMQGYAWMVQSLLEEKYAVALTDYEGLGETGSHPYLEPTTAAFNVIDAVRALRALSPTVSTQWVAVGYSQGGPAAWAANELDSYYGNGLQLKGTVALAPAVNLSGVARLVWSRSLTDEQRARLPMVILGMARYTPGLDVDAFLHGSAAHYREQLSRCQGSNERSDTTTTIPWVPWGTVVNRLREANDVKPQNVQDVDAFERALRRIALPQRALTEPMLVIAGERDPVVLLDGVRFAVSESCARGGLVQFLQIPEADHSIFTPKVRALVSQWIKGRFAGAVAPSNCATTSN